MLMWLMNAFASVIRGTGNMPVSYTHLDVYKRQLRSAAPLQTSGSWGMEGESASGMMASDGRGKRYATAARAGPARKGTPGKPITLLPRRVRV